MTSPEVETTPSTEFDGKTDEAVKTVKKPEMETGSQIGSKKKGPWLACGLSLLIPGAGQFYNDQYNKGVPQLGAAIVGSGLVFMAVRDNYEDIYGDWVDPDDDDRIAVIGGLLWLGGLLWSAIDAPISANRINRRGQQPGQAHLLKFDDDRAILSVDTVAQRDRSGARLTLRF